MEEKKKCLCGSSDVRVVAFPEPQCGPNRNQAALDLAREKVAGFFCLAGVGAHIKGLGVVPVCPECKSRTSNVRNDRQRILYSQIP